MGNWLPALIFSGIAASFAGQLVRAQISGEICIPVRFLDFEDRELDRSPSDFWAIVVIDCVGLIVALLIALYLWTKL
jgi:hypothetical protein